MPKFISSFLRIAIPLAIAVFLLWFAFSNVDVDDFIQKSKSTNYWWVIASIVLSLISYVARAYRWNLLLKPMGYQVSTYKTTLSVLVGYLANLAFPRLGEVTRCAVLRRTDEVPMTTSIGTVITERLLDAITLLTLIGFSFALEYETITSFLQNILAEYDIDFRKMLYGLAGMGVVGVIILFLFISSNSRFAIRLKSWLIELYGGIKSIKNVNQKTGFVISTIVLWVIYYLMSYIIVFSLPETSFLDPSAGFLLLVTGGIALTLPVQGGIGTYHTMITAMLMLYGIDKTTGLFMATLLHTSQLFAIAVFGGLALLLSFLVKKKSPSGENKG